MRYCARCVLPDTRPNLTLGPDGVCDACRNHGKRASIDWKARERAFRKLASGAKAKSRGYDCVIPVSGGKDSTWQTIMCLKYRLNPLAVTWKTPARTALGARNLANLVSLGVDHIDYQVNPKVERKFLLASLKRFGTTAIPMHLAVFNIPLAIAERFKIPLVVWGENSGVEYGGGGGVRLDARWLKKYGVTHGTTAEDWVSRRLTRKELTPYFGPKSVPPAVFLGHYFRWDPETSLRAARAHGFETRKEGPKTGYYDYADIDDDFISIHHFLKWHKFGFTRTFDNLSLEIRNGRMTRARAVEILRKRGDETPWEDIEKFCAFVGISRKSFFSIIERFRNKKVWKKVGGRWTIPGFLIPGRQWA